MVNTISMKALLICYNCKQTSFFQTEMTFCENAFFQGMFNGCISFVCVLASIKLDISMLHIVDINSRNVYEAFCTLL